VKRSASASPVAVFSQPFDTDGVSRNNRQPAQDRSKATYERLAKAADLIAATAEYGARVHDQLIGRLNGAADRAACQRRLAAAQTAAAVSYRNLEMPSDAVRRAIVESRYLLCPPDGAWLDESRATTDPS
jgi:hypothetical protein